MYIHSQYRGRDWNVVIHRWIILIPVQVISMYTHVVKGLSSSWCFTSLIVGDFKSCDYTSINNNTDFIIKQIFCHYT